MVSPNHLKTTLEAGGADELTKQIELSIVRKKMRLLLRLARDIITRTVASTLRGIPTALLQELKQNPQSRQPPMTKAISL